jgi:Na+/H+ antiporter NhaD/arsenite permease-like protein
MMHSPGDDQPTSSGSATAAQPPRHGLMHLGHPEPHIPGKELAADVADPVSPLGRALILVIGIVVAWVGYWLEHGSHGVPDAKVALPWVTPFVLLLGAIAAMPFVARHWWEHNYARVALALGAIIAVYYFFFVQHGRGNLARAAGEYVSFIYLLAALFVVSGGILIRVRARATPGANATMLLVGAVIANFVGTTGASMLLIRPYLRMNRSNLRAYHVVFFIFIVANAGGSLTPIGDPPLFLGYLKGVPFFWVFEHCWPIWAVAVGALVGTFFVIDTIQDRRNPHEPRDAYDGDDLGPVVSFYGAVNLLLVALVLAGVLLHAPINQWTEERFGFGGPWREIAMTVAVVATLSLTPRRVHVENRFNYAPIGEVAYLFAGIFATMIPALNYLYHSANTGDNRMLSTPGQYFFTTGTLSSVLDNAPTYLTFLKTEMGSLDRETVKRAYDIARRPGHDIEPSDLAGLDERREAELRGAIDALIRYHGARVAAGTLSENEVRVGFLVGDERLNAYLVAISMGAVLFGACTYIGNGPNFMVKSIAEHAGAPVPGFFGYIFRFTLPALLPVLVAIWFLFLR